MATDGQVRAAEFGRLAHAHLEDDEASVKFVPAMETDLLERVYRSQIVGARDRGQRRDQVLPVDFGKRAAQHLLTDSASSRCSRHGDRDDPSVVVDFDTHLSDRIPVLLGDPKARAWIDECRRVPATMFGVRNWTAANAEPNGLRIVSPFPDQHNVVRPRRPQRHMRTSAFDGQRIRSSHWSTSS